MNKVELIFAFEWICDNCGESNYERAVRQGEYENGSDEEGFVISSPDQVKCQYCGAEFEAE